MTELVFDSYGHLIPYDLISIELGQMENEEKKALFNFIFNRNYEIISKKPQKNLISFCGY